MSSIIDFITSTIPSAMLPIVVAVTLVIFTSLARRSVERTVTFEDLELVDDAKSSVSENMKLLIGREDVTLRVLEEVFQTGRSRFFFLSQNGDSRRASSLRKIQDILRNVMSESVKSEDFPKIRDRVIKLIDEAQKEIELLQQRKPFDGLQEPEKSLLIDMLAEIPNEKPIPRQKALQLADIIKLKHQDMLKLQQDNAKSAAWTRWGTYGTIFFGILSIVLSVYTTVK